MSDIYDAALKVLAATGPEYDGYPNHGSAVAHTLLELGRPLKVVTWASDYRPALDPPPIPVAPITHPDYQAALGQIDRYTDWVNYLKHALREKHWGNLVEGWLIQLLPGLAGAAGNPMIRTAHVLQAAQAHSSKLLQDELAASLAYWFASYRKLPGIAGGAHAGSLSPDEGLSNIHRLNTGAIPRYHSLGQGLDDLSGNPYFAGVVNLIAIGSDQAAVVHALTEVFCRVFLAHSTHPQAREPFMQAVNVLSATRLILPYIQAAAGRVALLRQAWQLAGGLYAVFAASDPVNRVIPQPVDRERLVDQTLTTGDEHLIRFVGSCLRENDYRKAQVYYATAWEAVHSYRPTAVLNESGADSNIAHYRDF